MSLIHRIRTCGPRMTWAFRVLAIAATAVDLYAAHKFGAF